MKKYCSFILILILFATKITSAQNEVAVFLMNKTGFDFIDIFISPADMNEWSEDLTLGLFNNYEQKEFTIKTNEEICTYDLKAVKPDSTELIFENLNLCKMLIVTLLYEFDKPTFVQDLIIDNQTDLTFVEIYVRDLPTSFWGMNLLGGNYLTPREQAVISVRTGNSKSCIYDIKAVLNNNQEIIYRGINICGQSHVVLMRYQGKPYYSFDF